MWWTRPFYGPQRPNQFSSVEWQYHHFSHKRDPVVIVELHHLQLYSMCLRSRNVFNFQQNCFQQILKFLTCIEMFFINLINCWLWLNTYNFTNLGTRMAGRRVEFGHFRIKSDFEIAKLDHFFDYAGAVGLGRSPSPGSQAQTGCDTCPASLPSFTRKKNIRQGG